MNHRSPGYEPDRISRLPHLAKVGGSVPILESVGATKTFHNSTISHLLKKYRLGSYKMAALQCMMERKSSISIPAVCILAILLLASLSGCLGDDEPEKTDDGPVELVVYYDLTNGTIEEIHSDGQPTTMAGAEFSFDFRETKSSKGNITTFTFDPGDGTDPVSINAEDESVLVYEYMSHGIFEATLGAEDENNNTASKKLKLRVEFHVADTQLNTQEPDRISIDLSPDDDSIAIPVQLNLVSTVENPRNPGTFFEDSVEVTWSLKNSSEEEHGGNSEVLNGGQSAPWNNQENGPEAALWSLDIDIVVAGGNSEEVNVQSDLWALYEQEESDPNPE